MSTKPVNSDWHQSFFTGPTLELWRRANPIETTEEEVNFLLEALSAPEGGKLLDVPCGNGRLSVPLGLAGYEITGVDACNEFLLEARPSAAAHDVEINFVHADMRQLAWKNEFDGAFCMGNSFGYFNAEGTHQFLSALRRSLKPKARFVLETEMVAEAFLVNGGEREWMQLGDLYMLIENHYDCRQSCVRTTCTFIQNGNETSREAFHWIYTAGELCRMLESCSFAVLEMFSSTEGAPFELGSSRLFLVAESA